MCMLVLCYITLLSPFVIFDYGSMQGLDLIRDHYRPGQCRKDTDTHIRKCIIWSGTAVILYCFKCWSLLLLKNSHTRIYRGFDYCLTQFWFKSYMLPFPCYYYWVPFYLILDHAVIHPVRVDLYVHYQIVRDCVVHYVCNQWIV